MAIKKTKKISELPLVSSLVGLYTIGVDAANRSVKISLEWLKKASDDVVQTITDANKATGNANTAAANANKATDEANKAADNADTATENANKAVNTANTAASNATEKAELAQTAANTAKSAAESANAAKEGVLEAIANANDTADHPNIIGSDLFWYKWDKASKKYVKTEFYAKGDPGQGNVDITNITSLKKDIPYVVTPQANGSQRFDAVETVMSGRNYHKSLNGYNIGTSSGVVSSVNANYISVVFNKQSTAAPYIRFLNLPLTDAGLYLFSFDCKITTDDSVNAVRMMAGIRNAGAPDLETAINDGEWHNVTYWVQLNPIVGSVASIFFTKNWALGVTMELKNVVIRKFSNDWSPTPEDIQAEIDGKISNTSSLLAANQYMLRPNANGGKTFLAEKVNAADVDWSARDMTISGVQRTDRETVRIYRNVAEYRDTRDATGTIAFKCNIPNGSMVDFTISVWAYARNEYATIKLKSYIYQNKWHQADSAYVYVGGNIVPVRLGKIGDAYVILFGTATTAWFQWTKVSIDEVKISAQYMYNAFLPEWTTEVLTDESVLTDVITPTLISRTLSPGEIATKINIPSGTVPCRGLAGAGETTGSVAYRDDVSSLSLARRTATGQIKAAVAVANDDVVNLAQMEQRFEGSYQIVTTLPAVGKAGVFYLVSTGVNVYEKYIWVQNGGVWGYKNVGSTTVDLSNYVQKEAGKGLSTNDYTNDYKNVSDWRRVHASLTMGEIDCALGASFTVTASADMAISFVNLVNIPQGEEVVVRIVSDSTRVITLPTDSVINETGMDTAEVSSVGSLELNVKRFGDVFVMKGAQYEQA